jgi:hypothetical protein
MNKILTSLALASLSMPVLAQGEYFSPAEIATTEGDGYAYYFGRYPTMKMQWVDGELRGKVANLKEIAFRLDNRSYSTSTGMGRTWTNFVIQIGEGDYTTFGQVSTANFTSTPQTVFSGSVTWPSFTSGTPATTPAVWGGTTGAYRFPFSSPWLYLGKADIVTDFDLSGGTLANAQTWATNSSRNYYFDSYGSSTSTSTGSTYVGYYPSTRLNNNSTGVTGRCNDSSHGTTTTGSYIYGYAYAYNKYYSNYGWRNTLRYYSQSYYTGYDMPVIHAMGFKADTTGLSLNTGCNNLHISGPMIFTPLKTLPQFMSTSGYSGYQEVFLPWNPAFGGVNLIFQAGWNDSTTGKINLSQARHLITPSGPPVNREYKRKSSYTYATYSNGPYDYYYANRAMRFSY